MGSLLLRVGVWCTMSEDTKRISVQMLMNTFVTTTLDQVYFKDADGRFILVSDSLARSLGRKPEEVVGKTDHHFFPEATARAYRQIEAEIMTTGVSVVGREVMHVWPDGHRTWSTNDAQLIMHGGQVFGIMGVNKDITARKLLELEVAAQTHRANEMTKAAVAAAKRNEHLAYHDALTDLPNRSLFNTLLNQGISEACRYDRQLAVVFLDLDRFKQINDTLGHEAGDQLLQEVASRLKVCVRESDTVARLGGDEFVVLLPKVTDAKDAATVAQKILSTVSMPFTLIGHEFRVTASVGIAVYPQDGLDEQILTMHADAAMYQAKGDGKNNFQFYSAEANANTLERLTVESSLRHALAHDEFRLHYQAKREVGSGAITGMEALLRWEHPDLGTVAPMRFIPIAEETGLIVPIGKWVLKTACVQNVAWQKQGLPSMSIAVNLTARQFADDHLVSDVKAVLEDSGMDPGLLELEIAESLLIQKVGNTRRILAELKALGVRLVIDDFGTGYSSLATLANFPLDAVKIDRSFIRQITDTTSQSAVADAIIAMGKKLSLTVIAQGVETREQAEFLRAHTCDELQGFYFKRPLPADQFGELLLAQAEGITYIGKQPTMRDV
jgi:diguanylate cyclase (GGDEF)-like protein/PAS domain S-box-containing protein